MLALLFLLHCENGDFSILMKDIFFFSAFMSLIVISKWNTYDGFIGQVSQSSNWFSRMTTIEKKLPEMSGQVSQVLEGMDKLNAKVEDFMQQLLACREDGVNVRNPKIVVATLNIEEVNVPTRTRSP